MKDKRIDRVKQPVNRLTELEQQRIIRTVNSAKYGHLPPSKIVPTLLDKGIWLAFVSSFYRVMKIHHLRVHRERVKPVRNVKRPKALVATKPNEIYTWDITYLPTTVKGQCLYISI